MKIIGTKVYGHDIGIFLKSYKNKHMTCAFNLKPNYFKKLPSAGHIDGTARPQFLEKKDNPGECSTY